MSKFIKDLAIFYIPIVLLILFYVFEDPFKVVFNYKDYYASNYVNLNRAAINAKVYLKNRKDIPYNAFIFGSSRSLAVSTEIWSHFLPENARPFHFDGNAESLYGIYRKMRFVDKHSDTIKHVLIFIDQMLLSDTELNTWGHLYIDHPRVNGKGYLKYHLSFLKAYYNPRFLVGYYFFKFTGQYKPFMGSRILDTEYPDVWDPVTSDLFLGFEEKIKSDSISYFRDLQQIVDNIHFIREERMPVSRDQVILLSQIKSILEKHDSEFRIVSNPFLSGFALWGEQKQLLDSIFGSENVFDFSGESEFSKEIHNFYDPSHFRPKVGRSILQHIYKK